MKVVVLSVVELYVSRRVMIFLITATLSSLVLISVAK